MVLRLVTIMMLASALCAAQSAAPAPPPEIAALLKRGDATVVFYDPAKEPQKHLGLTIFDAVVQGRFKPTWTTTQRSGKTVMIVRFTVTSLKLSIRHTVRLPKSKETDERWSDPLMLHELDHVAVTSHPRMAMLMEHLFRRMKPIERELAEGERASDALANTVLDEAIARRREAVFQLATAYNQRYDQLTRHGAKATEEREAFFDSLFTRASLEAADFPYLDEVEKLVTSKAYEAAGPVHLKLPSRNKPT